MSDDPRQDVLDILVSRGVCQSDVIREVRDALTIEVRICENLHRKNALDYRDGRTSILIAQRMYAATHSYIDRWEME